MRAMRYLVGRVQWIKLEMFEPKKKAAGGPVPRQGDVPVLRAVLPPD